MTYKTKYNGKLHSKPLPFRWVFSQSWLLYEIENP